MCIMVMQHSKRVGMANRKRIEPVIRVTVGLDESEHERLSHMAETAGVSLAWMLRRAAREFLSRHTEQRGDKTALKLTE
jgi:hypothetical protein